MAIEVHSGSKTYTFAEGTAIKQIEGILQVIRPTGTKLFVIAAFAPGNWDFGYTVGSAGVSDNGATTSKPKNTRGYVEVDPNSI